MSYKADACAAHSLRSCECAGQSSLLYPWPTGGWRWYTACVYHLYETDLPLNTVAQAVLGHEDLEESLSYANVRLRDAGEPGRLGTLEYQFTDMTESESNSDGYESE